MNMSIFLVIFLCSQCILICSPFIAEMFYEVQRMRADKKTAKSEKEKNLEASNLEEKKKQELLDKLLSYAYSSYSEELRSTLLFIEKGLKTLDSYKEDTGKLYHYYLPEMLAIFQKSTELYQLKRISFQSEEEGEREREAYMAELLTAANLVRTAVDEKLKILIQKGELGRDCDIEVLETVLLREHSKEFCKG